MQLEHGEKVVFTGDSITDCGWARPGQGGGNGPLGNGYVSLVEAALRTVYPDRVIALANRGRSGGTVRSVDGHWQDDVVKPAPAWISICIGINDVWRQFDSPQNPACHVLPEEYEETLGRLVGEGVGLAAKGVVLMTPFMIEPNPAEPMRAVMDRYGAICRRVAEAHGARFVDLQAVFDRLLAHVHAYRLAGDRIHPNTAGHLAIARAFLGALDFDWTRTP
ncbi:MAG: SGNH/GDSL hydrolase family protein [Planctomycetota bacterium]